MPIILRQEDHEFREGQSYIVSLKPARDIAIPYL